MLFYKGVGLTIVDNKNPACLGRVAMNVRCRHIQDDRVNVGDVNEGSNHQPPKGRSWPTAAKKGVENCTHRIHAYWQ
jgi:hypothetical protein